MRIVCSNVCVAIKAKRNTIFKGISATVRVLLDVMKLHVCTTKLSTKYTLTPTSDQSPQPNIFRKSHIPLLLLHQRIPLEIPRGFKRIPVFFSYSNALFRYRIIDAFDLWMNRYLLYVTSLKMHRWSNKR